MIIKIISLWQPWAWAMWNSLKHWETRDSRAPVVAQLRKYRGPLGIQAAKRPFRFSDMEDEFTHGFRRNSGGSELPRGMTTTQFERQLQYGVLGGICLFDGEIKSTKSAHGFSEQEKFWGNYDGFSRVAIHCRAMVKLANPIPMRGQQGLWDWEVPEELLPNIAEVKNKYSSTVMA